IIMSISNQINNDIKQAMLGRQEARLRGLRAIKAALLLAATEKGAAEEVSDEKAIQILQKLVKQRKDSLEIYNQNNRPELAIKEQEEIEVIGSYLPAQMDETELRSVLEKIIAEVGATTIADTGKIMPVAMKQLAGRADGKTIGAMIKQILG
ncbi:MAG: GatB/YqeY domain-containing protein, partial [Bacteroidota bacterium]|nr:GatB/YqeY domain-containing protein [Bacteroidota bacterium]